MTYQIKCANPSEIVFFNIQEQLKEFRFEVQGKEITQPVTNNRHIVLNR